MARRFDGPQMALFGLDRQYNYETHQHEQVIGHGWNHPMNLKSPWNAPSTSTRMGNEGNDQRRTRMRKEAQTALDHGIGTMSSPVRPLPQGPVPQKRQKNGYGEGAGFPKNYDEHGNQQGFLFANEAPARSANQRNHVGYAVDYSKTPRPDADEVPISKNSPSLGTTMQAKPNSPLQDDQRRPLSQYDTRIAKGSLTGHFDPDAPLYHGTKKALKGDAIVPGKYKAIDRIGHGKGLTKNGYRLNVYATNDKDIAEEYSKTSSGKKGKSASIYEVKQTGPVSADLEYLSRTSPLETQNSIVNGDYHAVKSPKPFKVKNQVQFPE